jgi:hypothetical protein
MKSIHSEVIDSKNLPLLGTALDKVKMYHRRYDVARELLERSRNFKFEH